MRLTHASWFSGAGGLDIGMERAGWETVSFSEIDPYASAVLARHWPEVPNLGDITKVRDRECGNVGLRPDDEPGSGTAPDALATAEGGDGQGRGRGLGASGAIGEADLAADEGRETGRREGTAALGGREPDAGDRERGRAVHDWRDAVLWSGGFPCQDLSVAGKRAGFTGQRSSLAFAFLDLVESAIANGRGPNGRGPEAILLENVPGLFSSNGGRDLGRLLGEMVQLGYSVSWRVLDARFFGVPQRRKRVFVLGLRVPDHDPDGRATADSAAAVLAIGAGECGHSEASRTKRKGAAASAYGGADETVGALPAGVHGFPDGVQEFMQGHFRVIGTGAAADPGGDRAADGLAGRLDDRAGVEGFSLRGRAEGNVPEPFRDVVPTVRGASGGSTQPYVAATLNSGGNDGGFRTEPGEHLVFAGDEAEDPLLPLGLDSHRYRCCGNGVVAPVAEWIGLRLAEYFRA